MGCGSQVLFRHLAPHRAVQDWLLPKYTDVEVEEYETLPRFEREGPLSLQGEPPRHYLQSTFIIQDGRVVRLKND